MLLPFVILALLLPFPVSPYSPPSLLKSKIYAACAAADRGFAGSPSDRVMIEDMLVELSQESPIDEPTRGLADGSPDAPLNACWRLIYTSASDVSTLGANPFAALGGIYQDARELPVIVNVIDTTPRFLQNLPPGAMSKALSTATRLKVTTRARPRGPSRVGLTFESIGIQPLSLFGQTIPSLPLPSIPLPQAPLALQRAVFGVSQDDDPRDSDSNPAYFDVLYLDDDFLVIKQGSPGGMFAAIRVDDLAQG